LQTSNKLKNHHYTVCCPKRGGHRRLDFTLSLFAISHIRCVISAFHTNLHHLESPNSVDPAAKWLL